MSSFFEKLKGITDAETDQEPTEEKPMEELAVKEIAIEKPAESEKLKTKPRKSKKMAAETAEPQSVSLVNKEEMVSKITPKLAPATPSALKNVFPNKEKKWPEPEGQLAVDVYQTEDELIIQSAVAGVKPESLDITAQGDTVSIKGSRENNQKEEKNYFYQECYWGKFSREIIMPTEADASRAQASMTDGILTIRIPKIEKDKKKKISVQ